ncbi:MAG: alanine racemase [Candidatus Peregrinibacteria bacterium]
MLTWVEISKNALTNNLKAFRRVVGKSVTLAPVVKANAYGYGLVPCARVFEKGGADYLCVNALFEAEALRQAGVKLPILILGYTPLSELREAVKLKTDLTVYNLETIQALAKLGKSVRLHLKIETGTHRQGVEMKDLPAMLRLLKHHPQLKLTGVSTHFANVEDRVNSHYAFHQLRRFEEVKRILEAEGMAPRFYHTASSAAAILFPETRFNFIRLGIVGYGLWPSEKTRTAARRSGMNLELKPALTWKTMVTQVKEVKKGAFIGYGCAHQMPRDGKIAVLPVGYYDGYPRSLGNRAHVLIRGKKAPVVGRICMNMFMVDVTAIPNVRLEDEVVLLGKQEREEVTAEQHAEWSETINYEVTTRINERIPRIFV